MPRNDEQIKKEVVDQLYWDSRVDASHVQVEVSGGKVTLSGHVPDFISLQSSESDAWSIPGVFALNNQLTIKYPEEIELPSDEEIQNNIRSAYTWNPHIDEADIKVTVNNHVVKLGGTVDSFWKKLKAEEIAFNLIGVVDVTNELGVVPTEDLVDQSISEEIMSALDRNIYVRPDNLEVKVENGGVFVSGTVPSWRAYRETLDSVWYTPGVTHVSDDITIK